MLIRGKVVNLRPGKTIGYVVVIGALMGTSPAFADRAAELFDSLQTAEVLKQPEIVREIEGMGSAAVPALLDAMQGPDMARRHQAIEIIGRIGQEANEATPLLIEALEHHEAQIRRNAAWALGRVGESASDAMPTLLETALDIQWDVRADAVWAMGKVVEDSGEFGAVDADLVRTVMGYLQNDESHHVRWSAAWSLARFGPSAEEALETLVNSLEDYHYKVRASAAAALGRIAASHHEDIVGEALTKAMNDENSLVRTRAAAALNNMRARTVPSF